MVIDEFYGWFKYDYFLRLLDRYPFITEYKGGSKDFNSKLIIITSNKNPNEWYKKFDTSPMFRRFDHVWEFHTLGEDPVVHHGDHPNTFISNCDFAMQYNTLESDETLEDDDVEEMNCEPEQLPDANILVPVETQQEPGSQITLSQLFQDDPEDI